ncbi:hypothetical protein JHD50_05315 [Sulfurimonas sp. MAG313]|nr:hypothetical protein [Sulfurimonas sp. MAG313]MDF1880728.1 hypothetical protein [Sulfurimonas sp. MAG313]
MQEINTLLKKYNNFKYEQLRSVEQLSDGTKIVTIVVQDDDGEDVNTINLEFSDIKSSKILIDSVLAYIDMSSGITLIKENNLYGFAIGSGTAMLHVNSAPLYIVASGIKITENS